MWAADLRVGVEFMDIEHAQLRSTLSEMGSIAASGYDDLNAFVRVTKLLELFYTETEQHFAHEEAVMLQHAYPMIGGHVARHAKFLRALAKIRGQFAAGRESEVTNREVRRVQAWFARHIITSDLPLAEWLTIRDCLQTEVTGSSWLPSRVSLW